MLLHALQFWIAALGEAPCNKSIPLQNKAYKKYARTHAYVHERTYILPLKVVLEYYTVELMELTRGRDAIKN